MVSIPELWMPILLSAAIVWIGSAIVWMALPHHKGEYRSVPDEEATRAALQGAAPGLYSVPHPDDPMNPTDDERRKLDEGPRAFLAVLPAGQPNMGGMMLKSFLFFLVVSFVVAYVTGRALAPDAHYLTVFRIAGTTAWLAYGFGSIQECIWFGRPWSSQLRSLCDGLFYGLLTAGVFGWMWPRMM